LVWKFPLSLIVSPSAAAPQNFILSRVSEVTPREEKAYDDVSSSWEGFDDKNYRTIQRSNLIDAAILLNNGISDDIMDDGTLQSKLDLKGDNKPNSISSAIDFTIRKTPGQPSLWNTMRKDPTALDDQLRGDSRQDAISSDSWIPKQIRERPGTWSTLH